ncbi:HEAT repeat domain-containing protein [Nocardia rhizosphaerae]|uniref:HEAT repeat domain-containing protein n=1 Tax=Nocardia rhizosphaerae TaxID=1691571 RepID=A0ABV8KZV0_9NOCA
MTMNESDENAPYASATSPDWEHRRDSCSALGKLLPSSDAFVALTKLLDDPDTAVEQEAAEVLVRFGGVDGISAVLDTLGRRAEDGDSDYIAYRLRELQIFEQVPVLRLARKAMGINSSPFAQQGFDQLESLLSSHNE